MSAPRGGADAARQRAERDAQRLESLRAFLRRNAAALDSLESVVQVRTRTSAAFDGPNVIPRARHAPSPRLRRRPPGSCPTTTTQSSSWKDVRFSLFFLHPRARLRAHAPASAALSAPRRPAVSAFMGVLAIIRDTDPPCSGPPAAPSAVPFLRVPPLILIAVVQQTEVLAEVAAKRFLGAPSESPLSPVSGAKPPLCPPPPTDGNPTQPPTAAPTPPRPRPAPPRQARRRSGPSSPS